MTTEQTEALWGIYYSLQLTLAAVLDLLHPPTLPPTTTTSPTAEATSPVVGPVDKLSIFPVPGGGARFGKRSK